MNERSGSDRKDLDLFGVINDANNPIFTKENILKQLYILNKLFDEKYRIRKYPFLW